MGREASCFGEWPGGSGEVTLRLEAAALELRGAVRRDLPRETIGDIRADGVWLRFEAEGDAYAFDLGAAAERWALAIDAPPPSLATKLGLKEGTLAYIPHPLADPALAEAAAGHVSTDPARANLWLVTVSDEAQLAAAASTHEAAGASTPVWVAHRKGKAASFGDNAVRALMRARGYVDSKSCAVSDGWSATRYGKR